MIAIQCYASGGLLQVVGDTTAGVHKVHHFTGSHSGRHIGNNHDAYSQEIALWDTNIVD